MKYILPCSGPGRPRCRTGGRRRCLPRTCHDEVGGRAEPVAAGEEKLSARGEVVGAHDVPRVRRQGQGVAVHAHSRGVRGQDHAAAAAETGNAAEAEEDTAASALLLKHEFLDGGADDVTLATLGEVLLEPTLTTLGNFLARSNSQSSVASASFTVGGFQLNGYAMTLSAFAWNIARTYTLTPGRRYSFGCRYWLGTASNLVMYVSAADNDYVGVTGTFLGTASQGVWSTARLDFGAAIRNRFGAFGGSIPGT